MRVYYYLSSPFITFVTSYNQYHSGRNDVFKVKLPLHYMWYYRNESNDLKHLSSITNIQSTKRAMVIFVW